MKYLKVQQDLLKMADARMVGSTDYSMSFGLKLMTRFGSSLMVSFFDSLEGADAEKNAS